MSHFTKVKTQFREEKHLLQALKDVGYGTVEIGQKLHLYGYQGDRRDNTADIVIRRKHISAYSNDIGFAKQVDGSYEAIISEYDTQLFPNFVDNLTQRYAYHVVVDKAKMKGFSLVEEKNEEGAIHLTVRKWS